MKDYIIERTLKAANYMVKNKTSIRETARALDINRSVVQKDLSVRLPRIDTDLSLRVEALVKANIEKSMLGGYRAGNFPSTVVECECTNCLHNNAKSKSSKGFCTKGYIKQQYKEFDLKNGDSTDVSDCSEYQFKYKGKAFIEG